MKPGAIQIGRNEPCPCGSGKRYMDCCLNTKYLITYNYKNQAVLIDKNEINKNLRRIIALNTSLSKYRNMSLKGEYLDVEYTLECLKRVYDIVDTSLRDVDKFSSCGKGCYACCNKYPTTTWIEVEYIRRYLKDTFGNNELERIVMLVENDAKKKRCPFLTQQGECSIYEVRPFECRRHLVFSDPKDCSNETIEPLRFSDAILDLARSVVNKTSLLSKGVDSKCIKMEIDFWFKEC